jgi:hypothetical protein
VILNCSGPSAGEALAAAPIWPESAPAEAWDGTLAGFPYGLSNGMQPDVIL